MIISRKGRFVFIANPRTGSTSVESMLLPYATMAFTENSETRHMGIAQFEEIILPTLELETSVESFAVVRDPIDWLFSWYRYLSCRESGNTDNQMSNLSFDKFVEAYLSKPRLEFAKVGTPTGLLRRQGERISVDHIYSFEHIPDLIYDLGKRLNVKLAPSRRLNISPKKEMFISPTNYQALEKFFAQDFDIYMQALDYNRRSSAI